MNPIVLYLCPLAGTALAAGPGDVADTIYVSPAGDDAWSGTLPEPNAERTDGPLRTPGRARERLRALRGPRRVVCRAGTYFLAEPLRLGPEDSGTAEAPVVWEAATGERVVWSGGRPIADWARRADGLWAAPVPDDDPEWVIRQFRVGDEAQVLARHPNLDPAHPTTGGWLFARPRDDRRPWRSSVVNIHTPGDWIEWAVDVPVAGDYLLWLYYGQHMKPFGRDNMDAQTVFQIDGGPDVPLTNLPNTGDWSRFEWSQVATLALTPGRHILRWTNRKGGGINFNAFALTTDPAWRPAGEDLPAPAAGAPLLLVQAEEWLDAKGRELRVDRGGEQRGKVDELPFPVGDIPTEWDLTGAQIMVFPAWGWVGGPVQVGGVDHERGILKLTGKNASQDIRIGNRYYLENVREALDEPGEFYHDRVAGQLLYRPRNEGFAAQEVVAPYLDRLLEIRGDPAADAWPEHIVVRGIEFRDSRYSIAVDSLYQPDDAAIWLDHARQCVIDRCSFTLLGGYAVKLLNQTHHCRVAGCTMTDLGQGGVIAVGPTATQPTDCEVIGCVMQRLGSIYKHVAGVYITTGSRHRVAHCTITDVPRYGISFKSYNAEAYSHDNVAEFCELLRTNLETNDTGAIETLGRDRQLSGNVIRYNLILDVVGMKHTEDGGLITPFYTWGIYLDDYSSGTTVVGNIVARTVRGGYHNHLGFQNVVENNILVEGTQQQAEYNGAAEMRDNVFRRNIVVFSHPEAAYLRSHGWDPAVLRECDHNVIWWTAGDLTTEERPVTPAGTWANWLALGFDAHSVVADPGFVDPAHNDYRLRPDSPALALGFEPIPVERIGVKGYRADP